MSITKKVLFLLLVCPCDAPFGGGYLCYIEITVGGVSIDVLVCLPKPVLVWFARCGRSTGPALQSLN